MTDETPPTSAGTPSSAPSKPSTTVTAGTLIMGTYEIEKIINSGGMGEVYRGRNIHNDEPVAIKIVLPSLAHDTKIVALFQKESTVLSRLSHDAIVRYHVFTNDPTIGRPCMVMEFVSGTALADRIEQGPMPLDDVKVMLRRVASGLDKAHKAGVVHRDLSPDNVILEEGSVAHAKLIDFGIAKSTNIGAGTLLQGQFAGKFNWVSPEQLGAFGGHVDGRSDIYSLALITAGASRGKVLPMGASIVDAVGKRSGVPDMEGVDPALVPLLSWMLQPDPALRTDSMATVIAALDDASLIPQAKTPEPPAPDPNRTVIEPLPIQTSVPVAPPGSEPPLSFNPPPASAAPAQLSERPQTMSPPAQTGSPAWDIPAARQGTSPPDGATVIAPQVFHTAPPPLVEEEPEDASPFGAPGAPAKAAPAAPVYEPIVIPKKGKGGVVAVLALLVAAGGGAGAYYGGFLDSKPVPEVGKVETGTDTVTTSDPAVPVTDEAKAAEEKAAADKLAADKAAEEQAAAEKAAADKAAADKAAEDLALAQAAAEKAAAEKVAAEKAAAEALANATAEEKAAALEAAAVAAAAEAQSQAEAIAAARAMAEGALAEADKAAADAAIEAMDSAGAQTLADTATAAARKAHTAADAATAGLAVAASAVETAKGAAKPEKGLDDLRNKADADATAAAESAAKADAAAAKAAEVVKAKAAAEAEKLAAAKAEEQAKADALNADPVARQQAFLDGYTAPACTSLVLREAKAEGFAFDGYAVETKPLEEFSAAWTEATKTTPDVTVRLINETQCPVLDSVTAHRAAEVVKITMTGKGDVVKSGEAVEGVIEGLNGRPFTLFYISDAGGATNMVERVEPGEDGTTTFRFSLKLKEGAAPAPQLMMVLVGDEALATTLTKLKSGVNAKGLFPYLDSQLAASSTAPAIGMSFFRLEN